MHAMEARLGVRDREEKVGVRDRYRWVGGLVGRVSLVGLGWVGLVGLFLWVAICLRTFFPVAGRHGCR